MPRAKKATETIILQVYGKDADVAELMEKAKADFVAAGHKKSEIEDVKLYLKHEDGAAYYVVNGTFAGKIDLF